MRTLLLLAAVTWAACVPRRDDLQDRTERVIEAREDVSKAQEDLQRAEARLAEAQGRLDTRERELQMQVETLGTPPGEPVVRPARTE